MTRRSALFAGLTVLMVLLGGQVVGAWYKRPATDFTTVSNAAGVSATPAPTPSPVPVKPTVPPRPNPTGKATGKPGRLAGMGVKLVTGGRGVALTFDDGPHPEYTPKTLALLRANHVHAVFCVIGTEVRRYPRLVAQIVREGHTLCNHSWHHEMDLGSLPPHKIRDNLNRTNAEILRAAPGAKIPYFRQPGGKWTPTGVRAARDLDMVSLGWTVDPKDWEKPPGQVIKARVLTQAHPGAVILLHDGGGERSGTLSGTRGAIPPLKQRYGVIQLR